MNPPMESSKAGSGAVIPAFYPILDTQAAARHLIEPVGAAEQLIEAGVEILQFRHKAHFSRRVFELMQRIAEMCRSARVQFVVNDRADLAVLLEAALHLGQDDLTPSAAREVTGPGTLIGYSTHNEAQLRAWVSASFAVCVRSRIVRWLRSAGSPSIARRMCWRRERIRSR
jgi:thiamine-phosphate diphosphorylase